MMASFQWRDQRLLDGFQTLLFSICWVGVVVVMDLKILGFVAVGQWCCGGWNHGSCNLELGMDWGHRLGRSSKLLCWLGNFFWDEKFMWLKWV